MEATPMKLVGLIGTAALSFILGAAVPVYAQQDQHDQQEEPKDKPEQNDKKAQPDETAKPEKKSAQQQDKGAKSGEKSTQQQQESTKETKAGQQAQVGGSNGRARIPDDRFKANFGREHTFRVTQTDYRSHRFQYGGYRFGFVGAWPSNWLYTQDVFVVDINGVYYLCNPVYPSVNVELSFIL
jgi:hypothetical protein